MQKEKQNLKIHSARARAVCDPLAVGERPGRQVVQSSRWESLSLGPSTPYLPLAHTALLPRALMCGTGVSTWPIPATQPTEKVKSSAVCFLKDEILSYAVE